MKLFIYEHITSGALLDEALPPALAHEGELMLQAAIRDFMAVATIELIILLDYRISHAVSLEWPHHCCLIHHSQQFQHDYQRALKQADAVLVIAPETDQLLCSLQQQVVDRQKILLGCRPDATATASDKLLCFHHLSRFHLPSPHTLPVSEWSHYDMPSPDGYIIKPRDGAGCQDTLYFPHHRQCEDWRHTQSTAFLQNMIIQPFVEGTAISLTVLFSETDALLLSVNEQMITVSGKQLTFQGLTLNPDFARQSDFAQFSDLLRRIHHALPGLWGFVGIDLILADNTAWIIDINPRLTTAYARLHDAIHHNPAQLLLTMMTSTMTALPTLAHRQTVEIRL